MEKLVEIAKVQSTEASNAIKGIVTTNTRIKQLMEGKTTPKNRDEQEIAGYKDFEDRFALVETKLSALETVNRASMNKIGRFTKQDIRELCPSLSVSTIEGALRKLVASGELKKEGTGYNIRKGLQSLFFQ